MTFQQPTASRDFRQSRFTWRSCLLGLFAVLGLGYLALRGMGAFLITGDALERGDAVAVLGGGGEERVAEAVRLVQEGYGRWLVITEPGEMAQGQGPGSQVFRQVAILEGISPDSILITKKISRNTLEEAEAVVETMRKHQLKSITIVTDPFHTQRTRLIFRSVFGGSGLSVRVRPVSNHWYRSTTWFLSRAGWENTLREYGKLIGFYTGIYQVME